MKEDWKYSKLGDICDLYQPKTISADMLVEDGEYLVYGANGIIGRYDKYNHEESEVLLTCRGATCGSINISEPYSWINGNAMVVHPSNEKELRKDFIRYYLASVDWSKVITGAAQPQITRQSLSPLQVACPPLPEQESIVAELDCLSGVIEKQKQQLKELDNLAQAIFFDMFGDPITNEKGWEVKKLEEIATSQIGITYKPDNVSDDGVIVLRSSNIQDSTLDFDDIVRVNYPIKDAKYVKENDILMCSRNGSFRLVGKVAMIPKLSEKMTYGAFMTIIRSDYQHYLFAFFKSPAFRTQLTTAQTATINQITVKMLNEIQVALPPLSLQQEFASKIEAIERQKELIKQSLSETETLFNSRMYYYFN